MLQPPEEPALKHTQLNTHTFTHTPTRLDANLFFFCRTPRLLIYATKPIGTVFTRTGWSAVERANTSLDSRPIRTASDLKPRNAPKTTPHPPRHTLAICTGTVRRRRGGVRGAPSISSSSPRTQSVKKKSYAIDFLLPVDALRERLISLSAVGLRPWRCLPCSLIPSLFPSCRAKKKKKSNN